MLGMLGDRCGSLAIKGRPVEVFEPLITHEFEPIPLVVGPSTLFSADNPALTELSDETAPAGTRGIDDAACVVNRDAL